MVTKEVADHFEFEDLWCGLTQYGNYLSCAAGLAAIGFYESENILQNVSERALELLQKLNELKEKHELIAEIRSIGLLAAIDLKKGKHDDRPLVPYRASGAALEPMHILQRELRNAGILASLRYSMLLIAPPLIITKDELALAMAGVDLALTRLAGQLK
jgi:taurine--2-oxoglutarate transaminase